MQEKVGNPPMDHEFKWVGTNQIRPDGMDKVTGKARFGADFNLPGQLYGHVLRSPHAHARIKKIDTSKAAALAGVKAIVTSADFPEQESKMSPAGEMMVNYNHITTNVMARDKVLYEGHAVAAVAATSNAIARKALKLIEVEYEILPHVIDPVEAMADDAPVLHDNLFTAGVTPTPTKASNVASRIELNKGDLDKGFAEADLIVEREFKTAPVHQGYIEPHACLAVVNQDQQAELWVTTQGHWIVRAHCARLLGWDTSQIKVTSSEIGGGFGGKTVVYLEPLALLLAQQIVTPGQDEHEPRRHLPRFRPRTRHRDQGQDRRQERRPHRRRLRRAEVPGRLRPRALRSAKAPWQHSHLMTSITSRSSATTSSRTAPRSQPIVHLARRWPNSPPRASSTKSARSSIVTRSTCACRTQPRKARRPPTVRSSAPSV